MKKLIFLAGLYCLQPIVHAASNVPAAMHKIAPVSAYDRAKAHFNANYAGAKDATWFNLPNNEMYCTFHDGKVISRVFYNSRGYWQYTLLSYPGSGLSIDLKHRIQDNFDSYHISYVNEIRSEKSDPVYVVNLENDSHIKIVKFAGDEIEVQQELYKE
ncbi:MAG TPA: hypothetical protein VGZ90_07905 [Puia sp.]|jgi:hypothetical protein|nr:hypothetical protein [Puia sp.]